MVSLRIAAWSLPELAVAIFAFAVWLLALSSKPANAKDAAMLQAQRMIILAVALATSALFLQHSGLLPADQVMWWGYLAIGLSIPLAVRYANHTSAVPVDTFERSYWAISAVLLLSLVLRSDLFVIGSRMNAFGFPQIVAGWGALLLILVNFIAIGVAVRRRVSLAEDVAFPGGTVMNLTWVALILSGTLEQLSASFALPFPPTFWIGALALSITLTRLMQIMHLQLAQTLEHTVDERNALREQVIQDELTGLRTRARGELELAQSLELHAACVLFIDLDDFKHWNDQYSHATGDRVLRAVAQVLQAKTRASDVAARYAGDEFFVALLGANLADGQRIAHEIETSLDALRFNEVQAHERVRASIGVVHALPGESVSDTLHRADLESYRIKRERGRSTRA